MPQNENKKALHLVKDSYGTKITIDNTSIDVIIPNKLIKSLELSILRFKFIYIYYLIFKIIYV